jgi:hypothetical protein
MEIQRLRARLALIDGMLERMDANEDRVQQLKRTVYVLKSVLHDGEDLPSPYGPPTPMARFSLQ